MDFGCPHRIVTPAGTITFNQDLGGSLAGVTLRLTGITGAEFAQSRATVDPNAGLPGGRLMGGLADAKYPTISGLIEAPTKEKRTSADILLASYLDSIRSGVGGTWYWTRYGQSEQYVEPVYVFGDGYVPGSETGATERSFNLGLLVTDPQIYTS